MEFDNKNTITVSDDLLNMNLRKTILASPIGEYVKDYKVTFAQGYIYVDLNLNIKTLGFLIARYRIEIVDLDFRPGCHILIADYAEDVKPASGGGFVQGMMLKAASLKGGTFLQSLISMSNPPGIKADEKSCSIDLKQLLSLDDRLTSVLALKYIDCRNGLLKFSYIPIL